MPPEPEEQPEEPVVYAVRLSTQADQDVTKAMLDLAQYTDDYEKAREWKNGLIDHIRKLAVFPRGNRIADAETARFRREVRRTIHGKYHVLYTIDDEGDDGPTVRVVHIRHASRRPLTPTEARQILANQ